MGFLIPSLGSTRRATAPREPLEDRWALVDELPVFYRASSGATPDGGTPPVVLVHGLALSSTYMAPVGELLAPHHPVYAPDLPGYGRSEDPGRVLDLPELTDAMARWMDAVGINQGIPLGNSFGCQIAAEFAARHPTRTAGTILQGPTTDPHHRSYPQQFVRWRINTNLEPPEMGDIANEDYKRAGWERIVKTTRMMVEDPIEEKLPHIQAPTLVVRGGRDPIVPQAWAEEAAGLVPRGRLVVVPGTAHTMVFHHALELARVCRPFVEAVAEGPA